MFEDILEVPERYDERLSYQTHELAQSAPFEKWCSTTQYDGVNSLPFDYPSHLFLEGVLTRLPDVNKLFKNIHTVLPDEKYFVFKAVTSENKKAIISRQYNTYVFKIYYLFYFLVRRVLPKVHGFRKISRFAGY